MSSRPYVETIVFVGGITADVRAWAPAHPDDNTPVVWGSQARLDPGGRAALGAVGAVRLGRRFVDLVGCVGDDLLGGSILAGIKDEGVSVRLVDKVAGVATGLRQVVSDAAGNRRAVGVPNANWRCGEVQARKAESTILGADLLYATLEIPPETVRHIVTVASSRGVPVVLDATPVPTAAAAGYPELGQRATSYPELGQRATSYPELDSVLGKQVDVLLANWPVAQQLAGMASASGPVGVEVAKRLLHRGPKAVVVTMGEHGAMVAVRGKHTLVEPFAAPKVDTTAAGDAFAAGLAVGLTNQSRGAWRWPQLVQAVRYASAAAAVCVSRDGSQQALPRRDEVERLLAASAA